MIANRIRLASLAATALAAAVTLSACSSSGPGSSGTSNSPTSSTQSAAAEGNSVTATETEFSIALSTKTLKAGTYTFQVKNTGKITHALTVDGPGVKDKSTGDISPGSSATLTVTLKAGSYDVFCPVGDHKMEGMDETVQVS